MKRYHKNPRKISRLEREQLAHWLAELGDLSGIVHDLNSDEIIGGNQRSDVFDINKCQAELVQQLDAPDAQGTVAHGFIVWQGARYAYRQVRWTPEQCERANIVANKAGGEWDIEILLAEFERSDLLQWGFDDAELDGLLAELGAGLDAGTGNGQGDAEPQIDRAEELRQKWQTEPGQLWQIGEHRLICGDCTDRAAVGKVMGGERAELLFTSPPYAKQRDYTPESDISDWDTLMRGAFKSALYADNCQVLVNLGIVHEGGEWLPYWDRWLAHMREMGWRRFGWYVWDKTHALPGKFGGRFAPAHEFIFHFNKIGVEPTKFVEKKPENIRIGGGTGTRNKDGEMKGYRSNPEASLQTHKIPDSVIRIVQQMGGIDGHPAPFPVGLPEFIIKSWAGVVYDPFGGSGTTMVACQNLGRKCMMIEISPAYCAVILQRMSDAFPGIDIGQVET